MVGSWEEVDFQLSSGNSFPSSISWWSGREFVGVDSLRIQGVAQVPWWGRFVFQGIQCHVDNQESQCFSMTFAVFSPVEFHPGKIWLNQLFRKCWFLSAFAKDPKEWEQLWSFIPGIWSLRAANGAGVSQVLLPWFYNSLGTGAVLDPVSAHLPVAPAPMELGI